MFFFERNNCPLVSVLMPTRGRPQHLAQAVDSIYSLSMYPEQIELIIKADDDDVETHKAIERLEQFIHLKKIISPRGKGYLQMHEWINEMSALATGQWLLLFNDDARIRTQNWDDILLRVGSMNPWPGMGDVCLLNAITMGRPFAREFCFLRRKTFEILGHFSLNPHNDNWINRVCSFVNAMLIIEIQVEHYSDVIGDRTREESEAAYRRTGADLNSIGSLCEQFNDAGKLLEHLAKVDAQIRWTDSPEGIGWFWYKEEDFGRGEHVAVGDDGLVCFLEAGAPKEYKHVSVLTGKWARRV